MRPDRPPQQPSKSIFLFNLPLFIFNNKNKINNKNKTKITSINRTFNINNNNSSLLLRRINNNIILPRYNKIKKTNVISKKPQLKMMSIKKNQMFTPLATRILLPTSLTRLVKPSPKKTQFQKAKNNYQFSFVSSPKLSNQSKTVIVIRNKSSIKKKNKMSQFLENYSNSNSNNFLHHLPTPNQWPIFHLPTTTTTTPAVTTTTTTTTTMTATQTSPVPVHNAAPPTPPIVAPPRAASRARLMNRSGPFSEQELVEALVLNQLRKRKNSASRTTNSSQRQSTNANSRSPSAARLPSPLRPLSDTLSRLWAESTLSHRQNLWRRLQQFSANFNLSQLPLGTQAAVWINSLTNVTKSTQFEYAKTIRALARRMAIPTPVLDMYISTLQQTGALVPTQQAKPASRAQVMLLIQTALAGHDTTLATLVYIMYKTASRFDDVLKLERDALIHHDPQQNLIVIRWGQTKTNRKDPFRASSWTVIKEENYPEMIDMTVRHFNNLPANQAPFSSVTYKAFLKFLRLSSETSELTAHSIKRGAIGILIDKASQGQCDLRLIPLIAKHKDALHDFPAITIRYNPNDAQMALALGTQHATRLL
jgi:hypothetical protein